MKKRENFKAFDGTTSNSFLEQCKQYALGRLNKQSTEDDIKQILELYIQKPLNIFEDKMEIKTDGKHILVFLPYEGDEKFFNIRPSHYSTKNIIISKEPNNEISFIVNDIDTKKTEEIRKKIDEEINSIKFYCDSLKKDIEVYNRDLKENLIEKFNEIKEKEKTIEQKIKELGIPERK